MILFKCTKCQGALKTSNPNLVGKKVKCPKCGAAVPVPAVSNGSSAAKPKTAAPAPMAGKSKAAPPAKAPKPAPPPVSDWEDEESPPLPKPKARKPAAEDDWGDEEEAPPSKKPAAKRKSGFDIVAVLVLLLLAGYITAVVLVMLDIVQIPF
jgi:hypothetical protein